MRSQGTSSAWIRNPLLVSGAVLMVGLLVTGFEARSTWKDARAADRRRFEAACESMWELLESQIEMHQHALERFQDFTENKWPVGVGEWNNFVHTVHPVFNYAGLAEIRFVALSSSLWRRLINCSIHPAIKGRGNQNLSMPAEVDSPAPPEVFLWQSRRWMIPNRNLSMPAEVDSPASRELFLWQSRRWLIPNRCQSVDADPVLQLVMSRAMVAGLARVTPPRAIGVDWTGKVVYGFTFAIPAYAGKLSDLPSDRYHHYDVNKETETNFRRCETALGFTLGSISVDRILANTFGTGPQEICMELLDVDRNGVKRPLLEFPPAWAATWGAGPDGLTWEPTFRSESMHPHYTGKLLARFHSTPLFDQRSTARRAWLVLWMGSGLSLAMSTVLWVQMRGRERATRLASALDESRQLLGRASELQTRISRDLHDGTVQSLFAIEMGLSRAARRLGETEEARMISDAIREMDAMIGDLRGFLTELDPEISPTQPAVSALSVLADRLRKATSREVVLEAEEGADAGLGQVAVVNLLQAAREGTSNALRHGGAMRVRLRLTRESGRRVRLSIEDDGKGFVVTEGALRVGGGLTNLRQRAESLGGRLLVESRPGGPTEVHFEISIHG
jgi:signal transduction histidine kinase